MPFIPHHAGHIFLLYTIPASSHVQPMHRGSISRVLSGIAHVVGARPAVWATHSAIRAVHSAPHLFPCVPAPPRLSTAIWLSCTRLPVPLRVSEAFRVTRVLSTSAATTVCGGYARTMASSGRGHGRLHGGTVSHALWLKRPPPPVLYWLAAIAHGIPPGLRRMRVGQPHRGSPMRHLGVP